ncbi:MAG: PQQ-binding-like beta-propeller repeat protein [Planctomycetota bacterium]
MRLGSAICAVLIFAAIGCTLTDVNREYGQDEVYLNKRPQFPIVELETIGFKLAWDLPLHGRELRNMYFLNGNIYTETKEHFLYKIRTREGIARWVYELGDKITAEPFVFVYDRDVHQGEGANSRFRDEVYVLCNDALHCIDEEDGDNLWKLNLKYPASSPPFASFSHVYYASWDNRLHAISKKDLIQDWEYVTGDDVIAGGSQKEPVIFFVSCDNNIYCADASRGTISWKIPSNKRIVTAPYFYRNRLYVGSQDHCLYAIKTIEGLIDWRFHCEAKVITTPIAVDMTVYCAADNRYFYAVDRKEGTLKWKIKNGYRLLLVGRHNVYILTRNKEIVAVDKETGELRWTKSFKDVDFFMTNAADSQDIRLGKAFYCIYLGFKSGWIFAIEEKELF